MPRNALRPSSDTTRRSSRLLRSNWRHSHEGDRPACTPPHQHHDMVSAEGRAGEAAGLRRAPRLAPLRLAFRDAAHAPPAVLIPEALACAAMSMAIRTARAQN